MSNSNDWKDFTPGVPVAVAIAQEIAIQNGTRKIEREHLLSAFHQVIENYPDQPEVEKLCILMAHCKIKREELFLYANAAIEKEEEPNDEKLTFSEQSKTALGYAATEAHRNGASLIGLDHFFIALLVPQKGSSLDKALAPLKLNADYISKKLRAINNGDRNEQSLSEEMEQVLDSAQAAMRASFCGRISPLHLLLGILQYPDSRTCEILAAANIDLDELRAKTKRELSSDREHATAQKRYSKAARRALYRAQLIAAESASSEIVPEHLLLALLPQTVSFKENLKEKRQFGDVEEMDEFWKDYDASSLRELLSADLLTRSKNHSTPIAKNDYHFLTDFVLPTFISWGVMAWFSRSTPTPANIGLKFAALGCILILLVGSGVFAAFGQLFLKNESLKERCLYVFSAF